MESRVSQQSNSLATIRTSQLITTDNELLTLLVMNHSNNSGLFKKIHVFHRENMNFYYFKFRKLTKDKASGGKSSGGSSGGGNKKSGGGNKVNDSLDFR